MGQLLHRCHTPKGKTHPEWSYNAVIYELNTRQFSEQGNFEGILPQLQRLKDLGVDIIWMMPIFPIGHERRKGTMGSYYSISDYRAVNPEFGTIEQFKELVRMIHELDMRVILDWVPNHTSRDAVWTKTNPEWYIWDEQKQEIATPFDWSDTAKLDYANPQMRHAMQEAMKYWLAECDIDGYRVDMAMLVPIDFWRETTPMLESVCPDIFMLAEAEGAEFFDHAFDACYGWQMHHLMVDVANSRANADSMRDLIKEQAISYSTEAIKMLFTSNHDENSWHGSEFERMGAAARNMAILTFLLPGIPLIYNGQEVATDQRIDFFEKDPIRWNQPNDFTRLYKALIELRHTNPALRSGELGGDLIAIDNSESWRVLSIKRQIGHSIVIGVFNLTGWEVNVEFYDGDFNGQYNQIGTTDSAHLSSGCPFYLPAWGGFVYYK